MAAVAVGAPAQHSTLRRWAVWGIPAAFTIAWLIYVLAAGHIGRVFDNWRAALTMVFGSFVAGSTPQGGGAVAFPVFTKVLEIPASVARSFSLVIQATGMVMASLSILLAGRKVDFKALALGVAGSSVGFLVGLFALGDPSTPFWSPRVDPAWVKIAFTTAIFAVAVIVKVCATRTAKYDRVQDWGFRAVLVMSLFAFVGGLFSSVAGSGADVMLFVFIVLVAQVAPKVAIPTSIIAMATVSVLGLAILGIGHGQLAIGLSGDQVVSVAGEAFGPESATQFDLFGIWIAAAPIVVWGAPLGAWLAAKASERAVIRFVAAMALLEVATTFLFLEALRERPILALVLVIGMVLAWLGVHRLDRVAEWIMSDASSAGEVSEGAALLPTRPGGPRDQAGFTGPAVASDDTSHASHGAGVPLSPATAAEAPQESPGEVALADLRRRLNAQTAELGSQHPATLSTRAAIAGIVGSGGDPAQAAELFSALVAEFVGAVGPDHPATLSIRANAASWHGRSGHTQSALDQSRLLLPDLERVLGADHATTRTVRSNLDALRATAASL